MKEELKKLIDPGLFKTFLICIVILYISIFIIPNFYSKGNIDSENLELEKQKFEYELLKQHYMYKVDSLENHIANLEEKKQNNIIAGTEKKKNFRLLNPTQKVIEFNTLFNILANEKEKGAKEAND